MQGVEVKVRRCYTGRHHVQALSSLALLDAVLSQEALDEAGVE